MGSGLASLFRLSIDTASDLDFFLDFLTLTGAGEDMFRLPNWLTTDNDSEPNSGEAKGECVVSVMEAVSPGGLVVGDISPLSIVVGWAWGI